MYDDCSTAGFISVVIESHALCGVSDVLMTSIYRYSKL